MLYRGGGFMKQKYSKGFRIHIGMRNVKTAITRVFDSCEVNKCLQTAEMRLFLCQISKKLLLYVLYAVVFYAIIEV